MENILNITIKLFLIQISFEVVWSLFVFINLFEATFASKFLTGCHTHENILK